MDTKDINTNEAATSVDELPVPAPLTPAQLEELKERASKADEYWERLLLEAANLENYKKRAARERQEAVSFANESLLAKLIPTLDTFEMAMAAANAETASTQSLRTGVAMISSQLKSVLTDAGLEEIDATGKTFDPNLHEAVSQEETSEIPDGQVLKQIRRGYKFRNRLMRPAGVIVAKKTVS